MLCGCDVFSSSMCIPWFLRKWSRVLACMIDLFFTCLQFRWSKISCSLFIYCLYKNWPIQVAGWADFKFTFLKFSRSSISFVTSSLTSFVPLTYAEGVAPSVNDIWNLQLFIGSFIPLSWMDSSYWNKLSLVFYYPEIIH